MPSHTIDASIDLLIGSHSTRPGLLHHSLEARKNCCFICSPADLTVIIGRQLLGNGCRLHSDQRVGQCACCIQAAALLRWPIARLERLSTARSCG